jgi:hypothetical protein
MSVEIQWDNPEKTTLRYSITIPWTWNEFWTAFEQSLRMIDEVEGKVDYISAIPTRPVAHCRPVFLHTWARLFENVIQGPD